MPSRQNASKTTRWRPFFFHLLAASLGGSALVFAALLLLDPWGGLLAHPLLPHLPADHSQRWAYPEIARAPRFDAAIIGNSTARLLDPAILDPALGTPADPARTANLAMVNAFPYEQSRLLDVFLAAHPTPRAVLVGIDRYWCEAGPGLRRFGYDPIPEYLYDHDRLRTALESFNLHALVTAWQSLAAATGRTPRLYAENGFTLLDVDRRPYDPALARRLIADNLAQIWPAPTGRFDGLDLLQPRLDAMPGATKVVLVLVPRFHLYPAPGSDGAAMIDACRTRLQAMAAARPDTELYDMAFPNPVTSDAGLWWDAVHARPDTMARLTHALADALEGRPTPLVRPLVPRARSRSPAQASE